MEPMSKRRLSISSRILPSAMKLSAATLPMTTISALAKPLRLTSCFQSRRLPQGSAADLPHCFVPSRVILLPKPKSMTSSTPLPLTFSLPVVSACAAIHSSRRVVMSFSWLYSSISFSAARSAGVRPENRSSPGRRSMYWSAVLMVAGLIRGGA